MRPMSFPRRTDAKLLGVQGLDTCCFVLSHPIKGDTLKVRLETPISCVLDKALACRLLKCFFDMFWLFSEPVMRHQNASDMRFKRKKRLFGDTGQRKQHKQKQIKIENAWNSNKKKTTWTHTHTYTHARTDARTHARTRMHVRMHACTQSNRHKKSKGWWCKQ